MTMTITMIMMITDTRKKMITMIMTMQKKKMGIKRTIMTIMDIRKRMTTMIMTMQKKKMGMMITMIMMDMKDTTTVNLIHIFG